jgi:hypothetical protein
MRNAVTYLALTSAFLAGPGSGTDQDPGMKTESIGTLIERDVKSGVEKAVESIKAKVGDILQFRIMSLELGRAMLSLQVSVAGDARKVAVVGTPALANGKPELRTRGILIFVVPERRGQAMVVITFVDNEGKPFRKTYQLELMDR